MKVLVVYAHPLPESYSAAVHRTVLEGLSAAGHDVRDLDLYAEAFRPSLSPDERRVYDKVGANTSGIEEHVAALRWAEALVFCYPTWWYGPPAILKGWLDRVWVPGVAFDVPDGSGQLKPRLTNIRKLGVVTTCGSPWWYMHLWMMGGGRTTLIRGLKPLFAKPCPHVYLSLHKMDTATAAKRTAFLDKVRTTFARF